MVGSDFAILVSGLCVGFQVDFSDIDPRLREECYIYRPILLSFSGKSPVFISFAPL
jgi:hypothetical protein